MSNFSQRVLTSLALLVVLLFIVYLDSFFLTWLLLGAVYLLAFGEACKLYGVNDKLLFIVAISLWIGAIFVPQPHLLAFIAIIAMVCMMAHEKKVDAQLLKPFFYPSVSMLFIFSIYVNIGMVALVWLVVIVALTDIGAYLVGKSFGKTPFSITSPNKTWEGCAGGVAVATVAGTIFAMSSIGFYSALVISFFTSTSSIWGYLYESYLKREAGVKDSGAILPGHGGVLDRVDGYLFGSVMMFCIYQNLI